MSLVSVEGYSNLKKDTSTGGVINTDKRGYEAYMANKRIAIQKHQEQEQQNLTVSTLQNEINTMKGEMTEIKSLLIKLLEKGN